MKKVITLIIGIAIVIVMPTEPVHAIEPIKVLIAKTAGVPDSDALDMLDQINDLMDNSNLSTRQFVNAKLVGHVEDASVFCSGSDHLTLLACAKNNLETVRHQFSADIVLMLVSSLAPVSGFATCGAVNQQMINLAAIEVANRALGRAVISNQCMNTQGLRPASHEVLHLLSIEHKRLDPKDFFPVGADDNHAASQVNVGTAGAVPVDCNPNYTCTVFDNRMSEDGENLSNGFPAGNSSHSNVVNVVSNRSWDVVAAYLPTPPPPACEINVAWVCENNSPRAIVTPTLAAGYTMTNIDMDYQLSGISNWYPIYDGAPTCPMYNPPSTFIDSIVNALVTTAAGYVTGCTVTATPIWCGSGDDPL